MKVIRPTDEQIRWFRQRRSGLAEPFETPEAAAAALGGVQAQILSAAMLALWNRSAAGATTSEALAARLFEARSLIRLWGQRHTLHLYASVDWPLIHATFADRRTWWEREAEKNSELDVTLYRRGVARVAVLLKKRGSLSRKELRESGIQLPEALLSPWGGVFAELVRQGVACLARWEGGEARYAHRDHWFPGQVWKPRVASEAGPELARRYFRCYGPGSLGDLAYWLGRTVTATKGWVDSFREELVPVESGSVAKKLLIHAEDASELMATPPEPADWPVRMLGRFDPFLLAHRDKDWVVPPAYYNRVWRPAGHIEGIVLDQGRAVATWRYERAGTARLNIRVFPFRARLPVRVGKAIRRQARAVAAFFGLKLGAVIVEPR